MPKPNPQKMLSKPCSYTVDPFWYLVKFVGCVPPSWSGQLAATTFFSYGMSAISSSSLFNAVSWVLFALKRHYTFVKQVYCIAKMCTHMKVSWYRHVTQVKTSRHAFIFAKSWTHSCRCTGLLTLDPLSGLQGRRQHSRSGENSRPETGLSRRHGERPQNLRARQDA